MSVERQGGDRWKCTLAIDSPIAQLTQVTVFEDHAGQWRPLSGSDVSHLLLVKKISRQAVYDWAGGQARWSGDVKPERAGPVALQAGDVDGLLMNLVIVRDAAAGKPLRYRLVDDGRAKPMEFSVAGKEDITIGGKHRPGDPGRECQAAAASCSCGVVDRPPLPARILQRKDGRDEIDLRFIAARWAAPIRPTPNPGRAPAAADGELVFGLSKELNDSQHGNRTGLEVAPLSRKRFQPERRSPDAHFQSRHLR